MDTSTQASSGADDFLNHLLAVKGKFNVSRISSIDGFAREDLPVAIAYRPNSKVLSQSGGKGVSRTQAMISALMESFECHTAEEIGWELETSYDNLPGMKINPLKLAITMKDYDPRDLNKWIQLDHLHSCEKYWAPFDAISLDFTRMFNVFSRDTFFLSSNGLASGCSWENAIVSGIYEVIERHSLTLKELAGTDTKDLIDLTSIHDPLVTDVIFRLQQYGIRCKLFDNTHWSDFPTYKAVLLNESTRWTGFGTHSSIYIAILRAITEANQARLISISGTREDMNKDFYLAVYPNDLHDEQDLPMGRPLSLTLPYIAPSLEYHDFVRHTISTTATNWFVYKYPQIDSQVFVVRVIAENLHGYNYPGYPQCTCLQESMPINRLDRKLARDQHSPAAG